MEPKPNLELRMADHNMRDQLTEMIRLINDIVFVRSFHPSVPLETDSVKKIME